MEQTVDSDQAKAELDHLTIKYEGLKNRFVRHSFFMEMYGTCLQTLLSKGTADKKITKVMRMMQSVSGYNNISIRKINRGPKNNPMLHPLYEINSPELPQSVVTPTKPVPLSIFSKKAIDMFTSGQKYFKDVATLSGKEKFYFKDRNVLSILVLPILDSDLLWGLITLEDSFGKKRLSLEGINLFAFCGDIIACFLMRNEAEEAVRLGEKRLRLLADNTLDCIWRMDMNLTFTYVNPAVKQMFGYEPDEWIGTTLKEHCRPEEMEKMIKILSTYMENPSKPNGVLFETNLKHKNGKDVPVEILGKYLYDQNGNVVGLQGTTRNIHERKEAEKERQRLSAQLRHSQKMEAIGTLAGGIAHDFNNILTAIVGYAELSLMDAQQNTRLSGNLQEIYRAGSRATELVRQILTFCRQTEHEREPIQIAPIVKEALKLLRSSIPTTVEIESSIKNDLGTTMADPTQIHQVVMNLCTNAAQAMEKTGGKLTVTLERATLGKRFHMMHPDVMPGNYFRLTVSDTGHGIAPGIMEKIFDPYFTTKKIEEGTGLGLSVSQGIVKSCGGELTVESQVNKGSTFMVYLPEISRSALKKEEKIVELPTGNQRILFVDDESALVNMGRQRLSRLGYHVEGYTSSVEALAQFQANPGRYDLVITDMTMPVISGDQLARRLIEIRPDIPIILCTGYSRQISDKKATACGIRSLLMKPITIKEMAETVKRVLS